MAVNLSALRAERAFPQGIVGVLISVMGLVNPMTILGLEGLGELKQKFSDVIGIQSRDLPTCISAPTKYATVCTFHTDND